MSPPKNFEQVRIEQLEYIAKRERGYRERALKILSLIHISEPTRPY